MAEKRKLQAEIDRCQKKVIEGVEIFDETWQKVQEATNLNQKEKYETDLKKEIKKLQRLRDQIKTWLTNNDVKDKQALIEKRKLIEQKMEQFKVVERETKTKAFSKTGLTAEQKQDPKEKEKEEIMIWLQECIDRLMQQSDQFESEVEQNLAIGKRKKVDKEKLEKVEELKGHLEKHKYHIQRLECIMRLLDNCGLETDGIKEIRDDIDHYIDCCMDPDFEENEFIYAELNLDFELTQQLGNVQIGSVLDDPDVTPSESTASTSSPSASPGPISSSSGAGGPLMSSNHIPMTSQLSKDSSIFSSRDSNNGDREDSHSVSSVASFRKISATSTGGGVGDEASSGNSFSKAESGATTGAPGAATGTSPFSYRAMGIGASAAVSGTSQQALSANASRSTPTTPLKLTGSGGFSQDQMMSPPPTLLATPPPPPLTPGGLAYNSVAAASAGSSANSSNAAGKLQSQSATKVGFFSGSGAREPLNNFGDGRFPSPFGGSLSNRGSASPSFNTTFSQGMEGNTLNATASSFSFGAPDGVGFSGGNSLNQPGAQSSDEQLQRQHHMQQQMQQYKQQFQQQQQMQQQMQQFKMQQQQQQHQQMALNSGNDGGGAAGVGESSQLRSELNAPPGESSLLTSTLSSMSLKDGSSRAGSNNSGDTNPGNLHSGQDEPKSPVLSLKQMAEQAALQSGMSNQAPLLMNSGDGINGDRSAGGPTSTSDANSSFTFTQQQAAQAAAAAVASSSGANLATSLNSLSNTLFGQIAAAAQQQQAASSEPTKILPILAASPLGRAVTGPETFIQQAMIDAGHHHIPQPADEERFRLHMPHNPVPTPSYYPRCPPSSVENPDYYFRLAPETLFFIFYYMEGTRAQLLAAKALKRQSWRFHTKYMMWFQRHEEPRNITDECEQGTYIYFDFERWAQRKKESFTFEYKYLEDRELERFC